MPQTRMRDAGGTLRTITQIRMRDAAGVLRTIQQVRMRDGAGTLRTVFVNFAVSAPSSVMEVTSGLTTASSVVVTDPVPVTVTGGTAPYTYAWSYVSGDPSISVSSATDDNPTFSATCWRLIPKQAVWKCTVTDSAGNVKTTNDVALYLEHVDDDYSPP